MPFAFSLIGCPISEKLAKNNFPLWKMQMLSALYGCQLEHYLNTKPPPKQVPCATDKPDDLVDNLEYKEWVAKDQQVVNYLLSSITKEVMV
jgi:hypothetical protein